VSAQDIGDVAGAAAERLHRLARADDWTTIPVPSYPLTVWPPVLQDYLREAAAAVGAPVDMAAVPLSAMVGGVIGNRRSLALKPNYVVRPSVWALLLADTTTGKSPMLGFAIALIKELQATAMDRFDLAMTEYEAVQSGSRGQTGIAAQQPRPVLEHFFTTNCTMEWIAPAARDSAGVAVIRDELLGWFRDLDAYRNGKGGDRQAWLSLWSGEAIKVDRKMGGTVYAPNPVVTLTGAIQPGRYHELARDAAADAMLARFLQSAPDTWVPAWSENSVSDQTVSDAVNLVAQLRPLTTQPPVPLSADARELFRDWHEDNNGDIAGAPPLMRDVYGKLPAQIGKIACILQACHDPGSKDRELPPERMQGAIDLIEYHRAHAERAYALLGTEVARRTDPRELRITRILRTPVVQDAEGWVARTTILNRLRNVSAEQLTSDLETMERAGTIERQYVSVGKKPTEQWRLVHRSNPFGASEFSELLLLETNNTEKPEDPESQNGHVDDYVGAAYEEMRI
jgi:hypothetical protein